MTERRLTEDDGFEFGAERSAPRAECYFFARDTLNGLALLISQAAANAKDEDGRRIQVAAYADAEALRNVAKKALSIYLDAKVEELSAQQDGKARPWNEPIIGGKRGR
ncbi:MAG: hypothetical protein KGL39_29625 [Patescibacteria group bacterium]|nr:hypothetical protein [Patescibacteria group bacterium]